MNTADLAQTLLLVAGLQLKHLICDGPLQTLAMVQSKRFYGRWLGLSHALIHGGGTSIIFLLGGFGLVTSLLLALIDFAIHYHVDFAKENAVARMGWTTRDGPFWWSYATDQTLHQLTYLLLAYLALTAVV